MRVRDPVGGERLVEVGVRLGRRPAAAGSRRDRRRPRPRAAPGAGATSAIVGAGQPDVNRRAVGQRGRPQEHQPAPSARVTATAAVDGGLLGARRVGGGEVDADDAGHGEHGSGVADAPGRRRPRTGRRRRLDRLDEAGRQGQAGERADQRDAFDASSPWARRQGTRAARPPAAAWSPRRTARTRSAVPAWFTMQTWAPALAFSAARSVRSCPIGGATGFSATETSSPARVGQRGQPRRVEVEDGLGVGAAAELGVVAGDAVDGGADLGQAVQLGLQGDAVAVAAVQAGPRPQALGGDERRPVRSAGAGPGPNRCRRTARRRRRRPARRRPAGCSRRRAGGPAGRRATIGRTPARASSGSSDSARIGGAPRPGHRTGVVTNTQRPVAQLAGPVGGDAAARARRSSPSGSLRGRASGPTSVDWRSRRRRHGSGRRSSGSPSLGNTSSATRWSCSSISSRVEPGEVEEDAEVLEVEQLAVHRRARRPRRRPTRWPRSADRPSPRGWAGSRTAPSIRRPAGSSRTGRTGARNLQNSSWPGRPRRQAASRVRPRGRSAPGSGPRPGRPVLPASARSSA